MTTAPAVAQPPDASEGGRPQSLSTLSNAEFLLEAVVCDVHTLALQVGAVTTLMAVSLKPEASGSLRVFRHLIHDDYKALTLALRYGAEIGLSREAVVKISALCREIHEAQQRLAPLLNISAATRLQSNQLQTLSSAWRRIAAEMSAGLSLIEPVTRARLNPLYLEDAATLRDYLGAATRGETKTIDSSGVLQSPSLKQRRRGPRVALSAPCAVETSAGSAPGRLDDASRNGLGLTTELRLAMRQPVTVVLQDGRRLSAVVVRIRGSKIGVSLATPLSDRDPIFGEAPTTKRG